MKLKIDINCDLGESYGHFKVGQDAQIMPYITSANVACGFHSGDPITMSHTVELAKKCKVAVGAHPGYPDLIGFGRREMKLSAEETRSCIMYQIGALQAFAKASNVGLQHVKPHGALYNVAAKDRDISKSIAEATHSVDSDLILVAPPNSIIAKVASEMGLRVALEVFADRAYNSDGTLVSRSQAHSLITDPKCVIERAKRMIEKGTVQAINGKIVELGKVHTICIHGDTPNAVEMARTLKSNLLAAEIEVEPIGSFLRWSESGVIESYQRAKYAPFGDRALKVELGNTIDPYVNAKVHALHEAITHIQPLGVGECVPTYCSLLITYDPAKITYDELIAKVTSLEEKAETLVLKRKRRRAVLPVAYGGDFGPDLTQVSQYHSLEEDDVLRIHSQHEYLVYMIGFIAGFPYLGKLPDEIATPRLETPRLQVPEGSVGIAENQTGIYPRQAPGGWRIIGRTPIKLFNALQQPPALFQPGDLVKFRPISAEEFGQIKAAASEKKFDPFTQE